MGITTKAKMIYGYLIPEDFQTKNADPDVLEVYDDEYSPIHFIYMYGANEPMFFGIEIDDAYGHSDYISLSLREHIDICTQNSTKVQTAFEDVLQRTINKLPSIMIVSMYD